MSPTARRRARRQRGLALVSVLWWIVIVAAIAAAFMRETRVEIDLARNGMAAARAEALANASLALAAQAMLGIEHPVVADLRDDGEAEIALAGGRVRLTLEDEADKIDLNRAPVEVLQRLFVVAGVVPDAAANLAAADYRDADDLRTQGGTEDGDYAAAGRPQRSILVGVSPTIGMGWTACQVQ